MIWVIVGLLAVAGLAAVIFGLVRLRRWVAALGVVLVGIGVVLAINEISNTPETKPLDPNPDSSYRIVALGDSYISGEGAQHYFPGTDVGGEEKNTCHRAASAYPYLAAEALGASLTFVACSGAVTEDVTGVDAAGHPVPGQHPKSASDVYGGRPQIEILKEVAEPDLVLISIGGNDSGFAEVGIDCEGVVEDCRGLADRWLHRLEAQVYPALVRTYTAVREAAHGAPVFALDYPNPIGPHFCNDLIGLTPAEMRFLRDVFVGRLNEIVKAAARTAGVRLIDITNALAGYRFCEKPLGKTAINFVKVTRTAGVPIHVSELGGLVHGTFHPNELGHEMIEAVVLPELEALRAGKLGPQPEPQPDKGPPPFVPEELGVPGRPLGFPAETDCGDPGAELASIARASAPADQRYVLLSGVTPGSTVCFRTYRADWESKRASAGGSVQVPIDVSLAGVASINEILVEEPGGVWKKLVVSAQ